MAYTTTNINFTEDDFILNKPLLNNNENSSSSEIKHSTKILTLNLGNTDFKYIKFRISLSGDTIDYCSINFVEPNNIPISVARTTEGMDSDLYAISSYDFVLENLIKGMGVNSDITPPQSFNVVVNGGNLEEDLIEKHNLISLYINVGKETPPTSTTVIVEYDCDSSNVIYKYQTGLHVYSPYDAIFSPKLTTYLYSLTPINTWSVNVTKLFSSPFLNNPALPYYYGYGSYVYKVGGELDRSFGEKKEYTARKLLFKKGYEVHTKTIIINTFNPTNQTSLSCITPIVNDVGVLKSITLNTTLSQPTKYRYYLGYDQTNKINSNDISFGKFSFKREMYDPITGAQHVLEKLAPAIITGFNVNYSPLGVGAIVTGLGLAALIPGVSSFYAEIGVTMGHLFDYLLGPLIEKFIGTTLGSALGFPLSWMPWGIGALILISLIYVLWSIYRTRTYSESCKTFYHHFTNTPYIEVGSELYRDISLSVKNAGYFCDGVYFYQQNTTSIINKELSATNAIISDDPPIYEYRLSIAADNPTPVVNFFKLLLLSYTSGKPLPYCGEGSPIYYNTIKTYTITGNCCNLVHCDPYTITVPAQTEWSCISQLDADTKAQEKLDYLIEHSITNLDFSTPFSDNEIGYIDGYFTHELKDEITPTNVSVVYDKRAHANPIVGTVFYYDSVGCTKALDGYYSISGSTYYRTFYKTLDGIVTNIYFMQNSNSTTTTTGQSIILTDRDFSSNWYVKGLNKYELETYVINTYGRNRFDTTTINYLNLEQGLLKTNNDPYPYEHFKFTNGTELNSGWYKPLIVWLENDSFYYQKALTISLKIEEECSFITGYTNTRGFYVVGYNSGYITPTMYPVTLDVLVTYDDNSTVTKNVTTNTDNGKTFVELPENYLNISSFSISNISPTSKNKITYIDNTTHDVCYNCNMTFTTQLNGFILTCTVLNSSPNYFVEITDQYGYYYSNTYTTNQFDITLPSNGGNYFGVTITDNIGCKVTKFVHVVVLTPTPTRTPTPTPTPSCVVFFDVDKTYPTSGQSDGSAVIITYGNDTSYSFWLYRNPPYFDIVVYSGSIGEGITLTLGGLSSQVYLYKVIGTSGCEQEVIVNMVIPPTPTPTPTPTSTPTCVLFPFIKYAYQVNPSVVYLQIKHFNPNCLFIKLQASTDGISWSFTNIYENICDNGWINDTLTNYSYFRVAARCPDTGIYSNYSEPFYFESE